MAQGSPELLAMLSKIEPGKPYGTELFNALARLMPIVGLETVCLRRTEGRTEVFMTLRKADEAYAEEWHSPGSIYRLRETDEQVVDRLEKREFDCKIKLGPLVGMVNNVKEVRGHAICLVHVCELIGEPANGGKWFPVDDLPENTIGVHRDEIIPMAVKSFQG
jgi:ADP-ribose pyrophosphatase YjhB (NUDIX family)